MAQYYYRATLSKTGEGFPASNTADLADFEGSYKSQAVKISYIDLAETTIVIDEGYSYFKGKVPSWTDVVYTEKGDIYELALLSGSLL